MEEGPTENYHLFYFFFFFGIHEKKAYHTKTLPDVNLYDIRKNTTPISQKTEVHFLRYLTPNMTMPSFFLNIRDHVPLGYRIFYHHF